MKWFPSITTDQLAILDRSVSNAEVTAYLQQTGRSRWSLGFDFVALDVVAPMIIWLAFCVAMPLIARTASYSFVASMLFAVFGLFIAVALWRVRCASQRAIRRHVRFAEFAEKSGLHYEPIGQQSAIGMGLIFDVGHSRKYRGVLSYESDGKRTLEIGRYQYTVGSGKHQATYYWRYAAVRMARKLPHMVLDSTHNNAKLFGKALLSNLPTILPNSQRVSLEGDFNDHFTLYAPKEYNVDARYILTPDVMAALIDSSSEFDVEIVDDVVFFYTPTTDKADSKVLGELFAVLDVVSRELYEQTDFYADDRVANARQNNTVATQGKRLKKWKLPGA